MSKASFNKTKYTVMVVDQSSGEVVEKATDLDGMILQLGTFDEDGVNAPIHLIGAFRSHMMMANEWENTGAKIKARLVEGFMEHSPLASKFKKFLKENKQNCVCGHCDASEED